MEDKGPHTSPSHNKVTRKYSSSLVDAVICSALNSVASPVVKTAGAEDEVILPATGFSSIACSRSKGAVIYWTDEADGTLGSFSLSHKRLKTLLRNLSLPTKIAVRGNNIFFVETGYDAPRLCYLDQETLRLHVLWEGDFLCRGLYVSPTSDVFFIRKQTIATDHTLMAISQYQVCYLPGSMVAGSLPGSNIGLRSCMKVVLTRSRSRSGQPRDIAIGLDGHLLLAIDDCGQEGGYIEVYSRASAGGDLVFTTDGMRVWRWLSKVMDLQVTEEGNLLYAGDGAPPNSQPTAIGISRALGMGRFRSVKTGSAICVTIDISGNIFYCPGTNARAGESLSVIWNSGKGATSDPQDKGRKGVAIKTIGSDAGAGSGGSGKDEWDQLSRRLSTGLMIPAENMGLQQRNMQVILRCRPLFETERDAGAKNILNCSAKEVLVIPYTNYQTQKSYLFNHVLNPEATQNEVFENHIAPMVASMLDGFNCTVFAYGQTGTGKTHTLEGNMESSDQAGIIPRCIHLIFDLLAAMAPEQSSVTVSHLEIYNEELFDLLEDPNKSLSRSSSPKNKHVKSWPRSPSSTPRSPWNRREKLQIVKDASRGVVVKGLDELRVYTPVDIFDILEKSTKKRATYETMMNKNSSRSHAIFTISVSTKCRSLNGSDCITKVGRINLVDLSGSENIARSGSIGDRLREAGNINQGLLALGRVIHGLVRGDTHIPYRDSKLTRILEESLGGNSITTMIITVSPNHLDAEETVSTLNYACLAKKIVNKPSQNVIKEVTKTASVQDHLNDSDIPRGPPEPAVIPWVSQIRVRKVNREKYQEGYIQDSGVAPRVCHVPSTEWAHTCFFGGDESISIAAKTALNCIFDSCIAITRGKNYDGEDFQLTASGINAIGKTISMCYNVSSTGSGEPKDKEGSKRGRKATEAGLLTRSRFVEFMTSLAKEEPRVVALFLEQHSFNMSMEKVTVEKANKKFTAHEARQLGLSLRRPASAAGPRKEEAPDPSAIRQRAIRHDLAPVSTNPIIGDIWSWVLIPCHNTAGTSRQKQAASQTTSTTGNVLPRPKTATHIPSKDMASRRCSFREGFKGSSLDVNLINDMSDI